MLFKNKQETWVFVDPIEILELFSKSIHKLKTAKIGESMTIHQNDDENFRISVCQTQVDYKKLKSINILLNRLLVENNQDLKTLEKPSGIYTCIKPEFPDDRI